MAEIKPFRGIRYAWEEVGAEVMRDLVAPPYDVIGEKEQEELYRRHRSNIVRLDLNRIKRHDNGEDNRYERARRHLFDWIAEGTLIVERKPTIYVHEQEFRDELGQTYRRRGFIALTRLAEYEERVVLPHERTLRGPKKDRLELMKATECNLSQIFFLFDDAEQEVDHLLFSTELEASEPMLEISTDDGIIHRLWTVDDEEVTGAVGEALEDGHLLIADGHHRYETALAYRDFRRAIAEDEDLDAPYEFVMGFFVNIHDPGLQVFPTHRVVHSVQDFSMEGLQTSLAEKEYFEVAELDRETAADMELLREELIQRGEKGPTFALIAPGSRDGFWVTFQGNEKSEFFDQSLPETVRRLDVSILHDGILEPFLGIDRQALEENSHLHYVKSWKNAEEALTDESTQVVVFMNATPVNQVNEVCLSGGKMPQKSTYFFPKILSGLAINPL